MDFRARFAFHPVTAFLGFQAGDAGTVDLQDLITATQSGLDRRRTGIRFVDVDGAVFLRLVDDSADASVGLVEHHLQVFRFLFRDIDRIGVQFLEHRIDARPLDPPDRQGVHIGTVQLLENGILDLSPFAEFEILGLGADTRHTEDEGRDEYGDTFHIQILPGRAFGDAGQRTS